MALYALDGISPDLAADVWVAPCARVIGKITLEAGSSLWFGSVLRGDNERITVGSGTNIQEHTVIHTDMGYPATIGRDCTIGHRAILHGCTIGDESLIGMGAIVLNGAKIGQNCIVGAGALVAEGKEIPDNSLVVGMPGRVVRTLDDAAAESLRESARHYQQNAARFRAGLTEVPSP